MGKHCGRFLIRSVLQTPEFQLVDQFQHVRLAEMDGTDTLTLREGQGSQKKSVVDGMYFLLIGILVGSDWQDFSFMP